MHISFYRFLIVLSILFFCVSMLGCTEQGILQVGSCKITLEEAHTREERMVGLMYRESLAKNTGMLFFLENGLDQTSAGGFHMRNVNFDLDLIFISNEQEVVDIQTVPKCQTDICPLYRPKGLSYYVLELNANKAEECGLEVGDFLDF